MKETARKVGCWRIGCLIVALIPIVVLALAADYYFRVFAPNLARKEAAFECYEKVLECIEREQYEEALKHADILVEMNESHFTEDALYLRAQVHARLNDLDVAIRDLTACEAYFARGRCYDEKGMREAAAADYTTVYNRLVDEIAQHNEAGSAYPRNYLGDAGIIQSFWTLRQDTDRDFGFALLQFQEYDSAVVTKRARLNAVLNWLREYVDVHPEIIANVDDLDAKVYQLSEIADRNDGSAVGLP